ncbi:hypothetical protein HaLaN_31355, partial [Haematococcus lacustris]
MLYFAWLSLLAYTGTASNAGSSSATLQAGGPGLTLTLRPPTRQQTSPALGSSSS